MIIMASLHVPSLLFSRIIGGYRPGREVLQPLSPLLCHVQVGESFVLGIDIPFESATGLQGMGKGAISPA